MTAPRSHAEAEKFFDHIADDYQRRSEGQVYSTSSLSFRRRQDIVTDRIRKIPEGGTVLDYGMGPGVFAPFCAEQELHFIGVDISPKMIELARELEVPGAEYHLGDLDCLDRFEGAADLVLLIGLIDYLEDPPTALKQLAACLAERGHIVISFRNRRSLPRFLRDLCKRLWSALRPRKSHQGETTAFEAPVLERSYVPSRDLIPVLESCGLEDFSISYLDFSPVFFQVPLTPFLWNLGRRLDAVFSRPIFSWMCASGVLTARRPAEEGAHNSAD